MGSFFETLDKAELQRVQLQQFIQKTLPAKGNAAMFLVPHQVNFQQCVGATVRLGDMVVAQASAKGQVISHQVYPSP